MRVDANGTGIEVADGGGDGPPVLLRWATTGARRCRG